MDHLSTARLPIIISPASASLTYRSLASIGIYSLSVLSTILTQESIAFTTTQNGTGYTTLDMRSKKMVNLGIV